ncbi:hypothetical protein [Parafrankia sp. FMc2]|uniref:hypothetical protein n=1 Tax=Parafrankia sp. FMc2 TaxID=3233196 RepID=UPI0034D4A9A0
MSARQIRRFHLERDVDVSGVSGTGAVAFGVQAPDGTCVLWWNSDHGSVALYPSMETLLAIHGHAGMTRAVYIDSPESPAAVPTTVQADSAVADPGPAGSVLTDPVVTDPAALRAAAASVRPGRAPSPGRAPRPGRASGRRSAAVRDTGRSGRGRAVRPSWEATAGSIISRVAARGGAARVLRSERPPAEEGPGERGPVRRLPVRPLSAQVSGRKHGTVGPSGSMV